MDTIKQKRFFVKRHYQITDTGVKVFYQDLRRKHETEIPFSRIQGARSSLLDGDFTIYAIFRISMILCALSFVGREFFDWLTYRQSLVLLIVSIISFGFYYLSRKDYIKIGLNYDKELHFFKEIPNESTVNQFIKTMIDRRDQYLKRNYLDFDKMLSYESQVQNLKKLLDYNVINQDELDHQKSILKNLFGFENEQNQIGF